MKLATELLKMFSRSEVKGQGHMYKCVNAITAEAYISTMWNQGSTVTV